MSNILVCSMDEVVQGIFSVTFYSVILIILKFSEDGMKDHPLDPRIMLLCVVTNSIL